MLDRGNFHDAMRRILTFFKAPTTPEEVKQNSEYLESVYESVCRMDGLLFDTVTKELAKSMTAGRRPIPSQFYAIYEKLKEAQPKAAFKCVSCNTTGWIYVEAMDRNTGEIAQFGKPCPDCRSNHPLKNAPLRQGWVECEGVTKRQPDAQTQPFIERLLGTKASSPDEAMAEITIRWHAGDFKLDSLADFHQRCELNDFDDSRRKNKLVRDLIEAPARETSASRPHAGAVEGGSAVPLIPPPSGLFPDGSKLNDPDIPF